MLRGRFGLILVLFGLAVWGAQRYEIAGIHDMPVVVFQAVALTTIFGAAIVAAACFVEWAQSRPSSGGFRFISPVANFRPGIRVSACFDPRGPIRDRFRPLTASNRYPEAYPWRYSNY